MSGTPSQQRIPSGTPASSRTSSQATSTNAFARHREEKSEDPGLPAARGSIFRAGSQAGVGASATNSAATGAGPPTGREREHSVTSAHGTIPGGVFATPAAASAAASSATLSSQMPPQLQPPAAFSIVEPNM